MHDVLVQPQDTEVSLRPSSGWPYLKRQMPGLDILRGIAVLAVVTYHGLAWMLPPHTSMAPGVHRLFTFVHPGFLGVNLFFVLSGFLITGILLETRRRANYWSSFYVRRVLRIMPLLLVTLAVAHFWFGVRWAYVFMCLFYMANLTYRFPSLRYDYGPLWSLAVEEQFYLIWPLVIRRLGSKGTLRVCIAIILLSPLLRAFAVNHPWIGDNGVTTWLLSDNLAWGALAAILLRSPRATVTRVAQATWLLAAVSAVLFVFIALFHLTTRDTPLGAAVQVLPILTAATTLLLLALRFGDHPTLLRWSAPLRFFGYISYGLYLLHIFFFALYDMLSPYFLYPDPNLTLRADLMRFATVLSCASFVCFFSRRYFEESFLRLKDRLVPYTAQPSASAR